MQWVDVIREDFGTQMAVDPQLRVTAFLDL